MYCYQKTVFSWRSCYNYWSNWDGIVWVYRYTIWYGSDAALILVRASTVAHSLLKKWRTPIHSLVSSFSCQRLAFIWLLCHRAADGNQCPPHWIIILGNSFHYLSYDYYWHAIIPTFPKHFPTYNPSLIKKMGLGLICYLIREVAAIILQWTITDDKTRAHMDKNTPLSNKWLEKW